MISKNLHDELKLKGVPLEVLLITANGSRNLVSIFDINFKVGPVHNSVDRFDINQALVMNELPPIEQNFPTRDNLRFFLNTADLVKNNKFPKLTDTRLNLIIGVCQTELINYDKLIKPANPGKPYVGLCKQGWTFFGPDPCLKSKPMTRCNFVHVSDDKLEKSRFIIT